MSITIVKAGILDKIQDVGRYGYRHLGIGSGGAMDAGSAALVNAVLGKSPQNPVLEMHYPAPVIQFNKACTIALAGADFCPIINNQPVLRLRPYVVAPGARLSFRRRMQGARCYLAVYENVVIEPWLNSYSTNVAAQAGGYNGRPLKSGDEIDFVPNIYAEKVLQGSSIVQLPWQVLPPFIQEQKTITIQIIKGPEWDWMLNESQKQVLNTTFTLTSASDTMGYRLIGEKLGLQQHQQLLSSGVSAGTLQLLHGGQLIVLMADHQTTGGYPRIGTVAACSMPLLAQMNAGAKFCFTLVPLLEAVLKLKKYNDYVVRIRNASEIRLKRYFDYVL